MKCRVLFFAVLLVFFVAAAAHASYWSLSPPGQIETASGDEIGFGLNFHSTETIIMIGWELDLQIDTNELAPVWEVVVPGLIENWKVDYNDFDNGFGALSTLKGKLDSDIYTLAAGSLSGYKIINPGDELLFASLYMDVIDEQLWDNNSDLMLLTQDAFPRNVGILDVSGVLHRFEGAEGPSVGSPVPVPGVIWLLGSGLLALLGIRRRVSF